KRAKALHDGDRAKLCGIVAELAPIELRCSRGDDSSAFPNSSGEIRLVHAINYRLLPVGHLHFLLIDVRWLEAKEFSNGHAHEAKGRAAYAAFWNLFRRYDPSDGSRLRGEAVVSGCRCVPVVIGLNEVSP